ncbi:MAG: hypothetical protein V1269_15375, partial [Deltaproteobacteria bacterium]|nr:hypothetical protein [Deltaproteobacteria bacterium]
LIIFWNVELEIIADHFDETALKIEHDTIYVKKTSKSHDVLGVDDVPIGNTRIELKETLLRLGTRAVWKTIRHLQVETCIDFPGT